ncbi:4'-phosphopantetheinyl transferase family protein [Sphingobacterium kitahiroshimense]|uniref:4'-phosphopantetheinyl transferase superfamily protein n=1 Tax=Sphingobacterium kitahiroshimense TaxID=470446 RepID=A0ABV0BM03_9SPHI
MIELMYCDIRGLEDKAVAAYMNMLPVTMRDYVSRYKFVKDRKARLIARLMLSNALIKDLGSSSLIDEYSLSSHGKPWIPDWKFFNISHSGDLVLLSYGDMNLGIDIEMHEDLDPFLLTDNLHPEEFHYLNTSKDKIKAFYDIWVRKEALLKAVGTGLTNNLHELNCLGNSIFYEGTKWYYSDIDFYNGYSCCVCSMSLIDVVYYEYKLPIVS